MNKEIEELLKEIKDKYSYEPYDMTGKVYTTISYEEGQLLVSYIEQLEQCYCNRTDCSSRIKDSKKYDSLLQKYEKLQKENETLKQKHYLIESGRGNLKSYTLKLEKENKQLQNNRDKALKKLNKYRNRKDHYGLWCMEYIDNADIIHILKGGSDE